MLGGIEMEKNTNKMILDLVGRAMEAQTAGNYVRVEINNAFVDVTAFDGEYGSEKDYLIKDSFGKELLDGSKRYWRVMETLQELIDNQEVRKDVSRLE